MKVRDSEMWNGGSTQRQTGPMIKSWRGGVGGGGERLRRELGVVETMWESFEGDTVGEGWDEGFRNWFRGAQSAAVRLGGDESAGLRMVLSLEGGFVLSSNKPKCWRKYL